MNLIRERIATVQELCAVLMEHGRWWLVPLVGVLVLANYGRRDLLRIDGVPVGQMLAAAEDEPERGSIMMIVATDAPLLDRGLRRLARRAGIGLARTGSIAGNGSGAGSDMGISIRGDLSRFQSPRTNTSITWRAILSVTHCEQGWLSVLKIGGGQAFGETNTKRRTMTGTFRNGPCGGQIIGERSYARRRMSPS